MLRFTEQTLAKSCRKKPQADRTACAKSLRWEGDWCVLKVQWLEPGDLGWERSSAGMPDRRK